VKAFNTGVISGVQSREWLILIFLNLPGYQQHLPFFITLSTKDEAKRTYSSRLIFSALWPSHQIQQASHHATSQSLKDGKFNHFG
jgi:hypothetical protein